jgi:prepilin-type N-terminal cleavage/methylation domain-containing protein
MGSPIFRNRIPAAIRGRMSILKDREDGFTLVELMASSLIVVLIAAGVAQGLISGAHMSAAQRHHSQADELAQKDQERLRGLSAKQLGTLNQTVPVALDGTNYTITSTAAFRNSTGGSSCGTNGAGAAAYYSTSSTVSWTDNNGIQTVTEESLITPPAGGTLLVKTVDQAGNPLPGVTVNATGPDTESGSTDANGCVILSGLAVGDYNLTLVDPGYVDPNSNPSPLSATATVTSSGTAAPSTGNPVAMGAAATLNVGSTSPAVAGFTTPGFNTSGVGTTLSETADAVSWYGAGGAYQMQNSASQSAGPGAQASTFVITRLFPFAFTIPTVSYANDYQVWAGPCRQMQPPAGVNGVASGVTPGSTQTITVTEPAIKLGVTYNGSATGVTPTQIHMRFDSTSGPSCSDIWNVPVASAAFAKYNGALSNGWLSNPGQPFASTATSGATASNSGLTGTLSICAVTNSRYAIVSGVTNTNFTTPTSVTVPVTSSSSSGSCPW